MYVFDVALLHLQLTADVSTSGLSATSVSRAITRFTMPAMSPTMTEGGIASWKKKEGEGFTAGDVLLEIVCQTTTTRVGTTPMTSPRPYRKRTRQLSTWRRRTTGLWAKFWFAFFPTIVFSCIPTLFRHVDVMTGSGRAEKHSRWKGHSTPG